MHPHRESSCFKVISRNPHSLSPSLPVRSCTVTWDGDGQGSWAELGTGIFHEPGGHAQYKRELRGPMAAWGGALVNVWRAATLCMACFSIPSITVIAGKSFIRNK